MNGATCCLQYLEKNLEKDFHEFNLFCYKIDRLQLTAVYCNRRGVTTPQMTRFRDAKVCYNWPQKRIDDHRIQSDYKYKSELQNPEGKKSVLRITSAW